MKKLNYLVVMLIALLTTVVAQAQDVIYVRDSLYIQSGGQLYVEGSVNATAGAVIFDDGELLIIDDSTPGGEDLINDAGTGLFDPSSIGQLVLGSTGTQEINGSFVTTVPDLVLSGSSTKSLALDTKVSNSFDAGNAVLDLNNHALYVLNPATSAMTYSTGYILSEDVAAASKVIWTIGTTTGAHVVPFGTPSAVNIPVTFNNISGDKGDVTFATYGTPVSNLPWPSGVSNFDYTHDGTGATTYDDSAYAVDRFWKIDPSVNAGTADFTFTYDPAEATSLSAGGPFYIQRYNNDSSVWDNYALDGTQTFNGLAHTIEAAGLTNFGKWWVATFWSSPLPVQLTFFTGKNMGNKNQLQWKTEAELNASHFELERSADAIHFEKIGTVAANGTSTIEHNYYFDDSAPLVTGYYRLKSVDVSGHVAYSNVVMLRLLNTGLSIVSVYPNPSSANIHLDIQADLPGNATISITDILGRIIMLENKEITIGLNQFMMNTNSLSSATYFLHISNNADGSSVTEKFTKLD